METSDSECFESADEDLQSEEDESENESQSQVYVTEAIKELKIDEKPISQESKPSTNLQVQDKQYVKSKPLILSQDESVSLSSKNTNCPFSRDKDSTEKTLKESKIKSKASEESVFRESNIIEPETKPEEDNLWEDEELDWAESSKPVVKQIHKMDPLPEGDKSDNMWENDDWEPIESNETVPPTPKSASSTSSNTWGSWGNWGMTSIINTATQSVSSLTSQVSQGLSTVLETGMGIPDPEELARLNAEEEKLAENVKEAPPDLETAPSTSLGFGFNNLVSGVSQLTKLVESTGTKVITGGLDTLETIGKKTMEVLQEGDPGLKKKRAFIKLQAEKPNLSQILREAKEKAEKERVEENRVFVKKTKNYETLFDDHQGLVHLEALEMLSKQCDIKLQTISDSCEGEALTEMQETMEQVKELCELPEDDEEEQLTVEDIKKKLDTAVQEMNVCISYKKLIRCWEETEEWLNNVNLIICDERELHQQAIETLAQLTAIAVEQFHKAGELLLIKDHRSTADEADSLVQLTTSLTSLIGIVAAKFSDKLNTKASDSAHNDKINELITNVFFEAANSSSYIQDAFQLLVPVLQVGAV